MLSVYLFIDHSHTAEINSIQHKTSKTNTHKIRSDASPVFPTHQKQKKLFINSFLMGPPHNVHTRSDL